MIGKLFPFPFAVIQKKDILLQADIIRKILLYEASREQYIEGAILF